MELDFLDDTAAFVEAAGDFLRADPVAATVVATVAQRRLETGDAGDPTDWWLVVRDDRGIVVGAGMRTAPFAPRPVYLLAMPDEAAVSLARALHGRGEVLPAINGALPAVRLCADELARLTGARVGVAEHSRLFVLDEPLEPRPVPGTMRRAGEEDLSLVGAWFGAFLGDADAQAGRAPGSGPEEMPADELLRERIHSGGIYLWLDDDEHPVHLTAHGPVSLGVARIGPVYTRRTNAVAGGRAPRCTPSLPRWWPRVLACACSPTRPTRCPTRSTHASVSDLWWTWPTCGSAEE